VKPQIRILILEDNAIDADLVTHALRKGGMHFALSRVDSKLAFIRELDHSAPDLILSDFSLPGFDGYTALEIARSKCPGIPFIFVTGTLGEEVAIETLKQGATDYVLKHRLARIVPSVQRALREAELHNQRRNSEEQLRQSHEQLRALSVYLQHVREEEQIRIAREVHDELGQALTGLKLQLTWLCTRLPRNLPALRRKAKSMSSSIDETIQIVRRIATRLRPGLLDTAGLIATLEWQAQQFQKQTGIQCRVNSVVKETLWDQDLNTAFFRIFQEALTNIIRHSKATKVEVRFWETNNHLVLEIQDNGRGISEAEINNNKSFGLLGMRERAALLGGEVRLRGGSAGGTTVSVRIPRHPIKPKRVHRHENSLNRRSRASAGGLEAHTG
jgi:signal transduction histidine kinase